MKKYKIGNRIITADSPVEAIKVSKMLDSSVVKASMKDGWTDVYKQFVDISNKYFPDTNKINQEITKLYSSHIGESDWVEAHRRWYGIKSKDSENSEIEYLTEEEERAVEDYRKAIAGTTNPKLLKVYAHILKEETEHIQELQEADVEDCDMRDSDKDSEILDLSASYTTADYSGLKDYMKQNGLKAYYIYFDKQSANKAEQVARLLQQLHLKTNIVRNNVYEFGQSFDGYIKVTD